MASLLCTSLPEYHTHKFLKCTDNVLFTPEYCFYRQIALGAAMIGASHDAATPEILGYSDQEPKLEPHYGTG